MILNTTSIQKINYRFLKYLFHISSKHFFPRSPRNPDINAIKPASISASNKPGIKPADRWLLIISAPFVKSPIKPVTQKNTLSSND